jgi:5-methyltetrahydrofolate--homocysteine methyltransferase
MDRAERLQALHDAVRERILVLDGSWGVLLQAKGLTEAEYRGERFADHSLPVQNNPDLLNLTQPDIVREVHDQYAEAGADIATTNTFTATSVSQIDYELQDACYDMNFAGAALARERADEWTERTPEKPRWVSGSLGPTNKTTSVPTDVNNPGLRAIEFDELVVSYREAVRGLIDGGVDLLLVETIFDTLNAKAAIVAVQEVLDELGIEVPLMLSWTATDLAGRNLSGQTIEAFWNSVRHAQPFSIGLNCSFGAADLRPHVLELARIADVPISAHPNAGLPNELGEFEETAEITSGQLGEWATSGLVNIVGGCCGTTPEHVRQIAAAVAEQSPRPIPVIEPRMRLAGIDPFEVVA